MLTVIKARDLLPRPGDRQQHQVRADRRGLHTGPQEDRAGQAGLPRRQPLLQPEVHRLPGRCTSLRRLQPVGHRFQGRGARLPAALPPGQVHIRETGTQEDRTEEVGDEVRLVDSNSRDDRRSGGGLRAQGPDPAAHRGDRAGQAEGDNRPHRLRGQDRQAPGLHQGLFVQRTQGKRIQLHRPGVAGCAHGHHQVRGFRPADD